MAVLNCLQELKNILRLMFVYTTRDIYLTLRFKFEIYLSNIHEIITYLWP
jgi:hypothetical protein